MSRTILILPDQIARNNSALCITAFCTRAPKVVMQTVERVFPDYPGSTEEFTLLVTHAQANDLVDFLIPRGHLGAGSYEFLFLVERKEHRPPGDAQLD